MVRECVSLIFPYRLPDGTCGARISLSGEADTWIPVTFRASNPLPRLSWNRVATVLDSMDPICARQHITLGWLSVYPI